MESQANKPVTWRRGLHRVFVVLWVVWALFVLVGIPIQQSLRAQDYARTMYRLELDTPAKDDPERKARENKQEELRAQATLPHIYRTEVLPDIYFWLLVVALPPVLLYALIRAAIPLGMWLFRGFKAP